MNKCITTIMILCAMALAINTSAQNKKIQFEDPYLLQADKQMLNTGGITYPAPVYVDYDQDGKKELLVGFWNTVPEGNILIYENKGSKRNPRFTRTGLLHADGKPAAVEAN